MNRKFPPRSLALVAILALAAAVIAAGCAKKITSIDTTFTQLEGKPDPRSLMLVYPEYSPTSTLWKDNGDKGIDLPGSLGENGDVQLDSIPTRLTGTLNVMLFDGTNASGYEFYRTASNGGLQRIGDFTVAADQKWLDSQWEVYEASVVTPSGFTPSFVGRGLIAGVAGPNSPLSNSTTPATPIFTPTITYTDSLTPADSLFRISWSPVPGAAGYWLQVYQFSPRSTQVDQMRSGEPAPIWNTNVTNYFVGYVAAPATSYKLGGPGALVLKFVTPVRNRQYRVRVTSVDAGGRVNGYLKTRDFYDEGIVIGDSTYVRYPMASVTVNPKIKGHAFEHNFQ